MISDMHPLVQLVFVVLAVARVTVLVTHDDVADPIRGRILAKLANRPALTELVGCPWCVGFWMALGWTTAWLHVPDGTTVAALPWAVAMLAYAPALVVITVQED